MQNSEARKRKEEVITKQERMMPTNEVLDYLGMVRAMLLLNQDQEAFTYVDLIIKAIEQELL